MSWRLQLSQRVSGVDDKPRYMSFNSLKDLARYIVSLVRHVNLDKITVEECRRLSQLLYAVSTLVVPSSQSG